MQILKSHAMKTRSLLLKCFLLPPPLLKPSKSLSQPPLQYPNSLPSLLNQIWRQKRDVTHMWRSNHRSRQRHSTDLCSFDHFKFTKEGLKSPKMVRFGRFKWLEPLKRGCTITWNGYLGNRIVGNAWFCTQTPFKTVAMATDTLKGNLTCIPYHLGWVSVW